LARLRSRYRRRDESIFLYRSCIIDGEAVGCDDNGVASSIAFATAAVIPRPLESVIAGPQLALRPP